MKAFHAAALIAVFLSFLFLLASCVRRTGAALPKVDNKPRAWILPVEANPNEPFCVEIEPGPLVAPGDMGMRCTDVRTVRQWLQAQRAAH